MSKKIIQTNSAPKAIGTYSQAVQKNNIVFLSGQIPLNPETMDLVEGIEEQIHQVFKNMIEVIKAADSSTDDLVMSPMALSLKMHLLRQDMHQKIQAYLQ